MSKTNASHWWIKRPGRTKAYLRRLFGEKAFNPDGTIKVAFLRKAIQRLKEKGKLKGRRGSLYRALLLALRIKRGEFA